MEEHKDIERKIFLIKNYLKGELSAGDAGELKDWLGDSEERRGMLQRMQDKKNLLEKLEFYRSAGSAEDWEMICRKSGISSRKLLYTRIARYAAVLVGVFLISLAFVKLTRPGGGEKPLAAAIATDSIRPGFRQAYIELAGGEKIMLGDSVKRLVKNIEGAVLKEEQDGLVMVSDSSSKEDARKIEYNRIVVPRGGEYQLTLADGTKVWLNSDTKLEFPVVFSGKARKVRLSGEAYFQVKPDKSAPFCVEVNKMEIVVLGTSFNVHAYDETIKTTLVEGRVEVKFEGASYRLTPGYEANVNRGKVTVGKADLYERTAWKDGKFVFREKRLEEVLAILSRWYDIEIFYQNSSVKDLHFTGNVPRHATIGEVLKFLEHTGIVRFTIAGRTVIVSA